MFYSLTTETTFSDACGKGYGACCYVKNIVNNEPQVHLFLACGNLVPLKLENNMISRSELKYFEDFVMIYSPKQTFN